MPCTVVVGVQWGDEGKGKIVDALSANVDLVARYQGGPNAGHSVRRGGVTHVLHLVPSGALYDGRRCLIGNGTVIDIPRLQAEVAALGAAGINVGPRLGISESAHLILPYHRAIEESFESRPGAIGTTGRGIGFAYRDKASRVGVRVADLFEPESFCLSVDRNLERLRLEFPSVAQLVDTSGASLLKELAGAIEWIRPMVCDVSLEIHTALAGGQRVLLEGAQGTLLDIDHGTYPFVTSSAAGAGGAPQGVGLGPRIVDRVIGVTKAYATRVGNGPFPSEMEPQAAELLRQAGEEYGATTGRPRRCGWLDMVALRYAARINGLDELVVTKLDILDGFDEVQVAVGYTCDGELLDRVPASAAVLERCRPVWKSFSGWSASTRDVRRWADLPAAARAYVEWIESEVGLPIRAVSVGADQDAEVPRS